MFEIFFGFGKPVVLLIFLVSVTLSAFWVHFCLKRKASVNLLPVIILNFVFFAIWPFIARIDHDGAAHLHLAWLVSEGSIPFKDFWQHQSPLFWVLLAPLLKAVLPTAQIFVLSRVICALVFLINLSLGWMIAVKVWQKKADPFAYLLIVSSTAVAADFFIIRPDILMIFFLLCGIYLTLDIPKKGLLSSFLSGISFALAASFIMKQYLLITLPVIAAFFAADKSYFKRITAYIFGLLVGFLPLFSYLASKGIIGEFILWVFGFNKMIIAISIFFPLAVLLLAIWGARTLFINYLKKRESRYLILLCAFFLSTISSLTSTSTVNGGRYLAFWFFICAIVSSGLTLDRLFDKIKSLFRKSLLAGVFLGLLLTPNISYTINCCHESNFKQDLLGIDELIEFGLNDSCIVLLPMHPVFVPDATRLYSEWEFFYTDIFQCLLNDAKSINIASQIVNLRPAVIMRDYRKRDFILDLFQRRLISSQEYNYLVPFLRANYTSIRLCDNRYYVRNDRISSEKFMELETE